MNKFFCYGREFETFEEMVKFSKEWPDMPFDEEQFMRWLRARQYDCRMTNLCYAKLSEPFTNADAFKMIDMSMPDWGRSIDR